MVEICTKYGHQEGRNCSTSFSPSFSPRLSFCVHGAVPLFIGYLFSLAIFGLVPGDLHAPTAGGAWDNAKKIVEVDMHQKGTPSLHQTLTVIGDTVWRSVQRSRRRWQ